MMNVNLCATLKHLLLKAKVLFRNETFLS